MAEFRSWKSYWEFEKAIKYRSRYIHGADVREFLDTILVTSKDRRRRILKDNYFWRAIYGCKEPKDDYDHHRPFSSQFFKPKPNKAFEGRANPKGIPYLYLSTDKETAMAEIRPWIQTFISIGRFKTTRDLLIIDCSKDNPKIPRIYFGEPKPEERECSVWANINKAFSTPINRSDEISDYAPTQIIAELFKANGYDGIMYKSALGDGLNLVLFDPESVKIVNRSLYKLNNISFEFRRYENLGHYQKEMQKISRKIKKLADNKQSRK